MVEMKPVKAFASCTARCASYGAAVLHILRHCRKMLHKSTSSQAMPQSLQTFTDLYRQGDENLSVSGSRKTQVVFFCLFCGPGGPVGPNGLKKVKLSILSIGSIRSIGSFYSFDNRCCSVSFKSSFSVLGISTYSCHKPSKNLFC